MAASAEIKCVKCNKSGPGDQAKLYCGKFINDPIDRLKTMQSVNKIYCSYQMLGNTFVDICDECVKFKRLEKLFWFLPAIGLLGIEVILFSIIKIFKVPDKSFLFFLLQLGAIGCYYTFFRFFIDILNLLFESKKATREMLARDVKTKEDKEMSYFTEAGYKRLKPKYRYK